MIGDIVTWLHDKVFGGAQRRTLSLSSSPDYRDEAINLCGANALGKISWVRLERCDDALDLR